MFVFLSSILATAMIVAAATNLPLDDDACVTHGEDSKGHRSMILRRMVREVTTGTNSLAMSEEAGGDDLESAFKDLDNFLQTNGFAESGIEGHAQSDSNISDAQMNKYTEWAKDLNANTICQTGFKAGHSTLRFLTQTDARLYEFDKCEQAHAKPVADYLATNYPERFTLICGDTSATLPDFAKAYPEIRCDILTISGIDSANVALLDLSNIAKMAAENAVIAIDNTPCQEDKCAGPSEAWTKFVADGCIDDASTVSISDAHGFSFGNVKACTLLQGTESVGHNEQSVTGEQEEEAKEKDEEETEEHENEEEEKEKEEKEKKEKEEKEREAKEKEAKEKEEKEKQEKEEKEREAKEKEEKEKEEKEKKEKEEKEKAEKEKAEKEKEKKEKEEKEKKEQEEQEKAKAYGMMESSARDPSNEGVNHLFDELDSFLAASGFPLGSMDDHVRFDQQFLDKQSSKYDEWASTLNLNTVCETGFGAGHSALRFLAQTKAKVYTFDLCQSNHTRSAADFLNVRYPGRLTLACGNSGVTLPNFLKTYPDVKCDLLLIDGDRSLDIAASDMTHLAKMATPNALIAMDDTPCEGHYWCDGPTEAWTRSIADGCIEEESKVPMGDARGFSYGRVKSCARFQDQHA